MNFQKTKRNLNIEIMKSSSLNYKIQPFLQYTRILIKEQYLIYDTKNVTK